MSVASCVSRVRIHYTVASSNLLLECVCNFLLPYCIIMVSIGITRDYRNVNLVRLVMQFPPLKCVETVCQFKSFSVYYCCYTHLASESSLLVHTCCYTGPVTTTSITWRSQAGAPSRRTVFYASDSQTVFPRPYIFFARHFKGLCLALRGGSTFRICLNNNTIMNIGP